MTGEGRIAEHWLIDGRVQGVGYRMWLEAQARSAGVEGWVRNLADGRVEALLRGPASSLACLAQAARNGPRFAAVGQVLVRPWTGDVPEGRFVQVATASHPERE